ncbi:MAG: response regulator [Candidatus Anammoxibacter sp.]
MKIRLKLILGFLSVVLIVVFVGYFSSNASQKALQKSIEENAMSLAVETLDKIDRNIYGRIEDFQSYSKSLNILEVVSDSNQKFEKLINIQSYITKKDQEWTSVAKGEITSFMQDIMDNKLSIELKETLEFYQNKYDYKLLGEVFVTNKYGANVAQTGKTTDYRQDDEKWWQEGKREGLFVNDLEYDESAGVFSTDIVIRIDDEKGNFIGMIKDVLNVVEVINIINKLEESMSRKGSKFIEYTLIKADGKLIYSTTADKYLEEGSDILNGHKLLKGEYTGKYIEKGNDGNFLAVYAQSRGYREYEGLGWIFLIKYNTEEIFAPANVLRNKILIISLIATIFALLAGLSISRSIARPIIKLKDTSVEIGQGNLDIKIDVKSNDEIGQLARSFNDMICKLRESKELEKNYTGSLEEKVEKRTKELAVARDQAVSANKSKSEFLSTMSHEIRTPMNAIMGLTHLVLQTELTKKQRDYLIKSQTSAQSLLGIINDILDFSKIEAGKLDMDTVGFDLESVLDNLSCVLSIRAEEKGLDILFHISEDLPLYLVGDPLRLGQILLNLASNAVKFTETGEVVVKIERDQKSDQDNDNVALRFSVKDTGIGLSQDQIRKLFQSFSQADSSITRKFGGTGLGLVISKRLVEMMGGEIWVESEPGKGCNFIFTARFGLQKEKDKRIFLPPEDLNGMNILVVDDSETSRHILKSYLESFSFKVSLAESGKEAISMLQNAEEPFRLVLMDWKMPDMNGIQASKIIKEHPGISTKPSIIMVTAYGREDIIPEVKDAGLDGFLVKPVNRSLLFDNISEVFGKTLMSEKSAGLLPSVKSKALQKIKGAKILLVEDNLINQLVAKDLLEDAGFVVTIANNGKEAVGKVREDDFDAVLMDLEMPEMDGYEATRRIRSEPKFRELPIISMTAHAMAGLKEKCLDAGMVDYTTKPINPEGLFKTLTKWIKPMEREVPVSKNESVNGEEKTAPAVADTDGVENAVAGLPGLNVAEGLTRVNGNIQRYRDYLAMFAVNHGGEDVKLEAKWRKEGAENASKGAHALKGAAGNLALPRVCKAAAALESVFKEEKPDENRIKAAINELSDALKEALESIKAYVKPDESKETDKQRPIDVSKANAILGELTVFINDGDAAALDAADKLMSILKGGNLIKESSALKKHLMEYDFDEAKEVVITIKEKIGAKGK